MFFAMMLTHDCFDMCLRADTILDFFVYDIRGVRPSYVYTLQWASHRHTICRQGNGAATSCVEPVRGEDVAVEDPEPAPHPSTVCFLYPLVCVTSCGGVSVSCDLKLVHRAFIMCDDRAFTWGCRSKCAVL